MDVPQDVPLMRAVADRLGRVDEFIAMAALLVVVGSVAWGVVTRYLFPQPAAWSYEVATIGFAWMVFFGAAAGVRRRAHADIDVLVVMLPRSMQRAVAVFNWWLLTGFFALLTVLFAWQAVVAHHVYTVALVLPRSVIYAPLAVASALMLIQHLALERPWRVGAGVEVRV
ncbi:TRAP transporter small permease [Azospirillum oleiclasticum]|nr:TRAP transporter small permease [Azospirillum oleiclasticum]